MRTGPTTGRRRIRAGLLAVLAPVLVAAGCQQFPELDRAVDPAVKTAPFPALKPFETLLPPPPPDVSAADLMAQGAGLQSRATALSTAP